MKSASTILILLAIGLPVYGEQEGGQAAKDQQPSKPTSAPASAPTGKAKCVIQENGTTVQCEWAAGNSPSYLQRLFVPENLPNLLLFTVGASGIGVAICTLYKVKRQTKATEIAARASRKSVDIAANAQRAWLSTEVMFVARLEDYARQGLPEVSAMLITIKNSGNSPAEISQAKIIALLSPFELPTEPVYDDLEVAAVGGAVIAPGSKSIAAVRIREHILFTRTEIDQVFARTRKLSATVALTTLTARA